jgi:hypothetical protein
METNKMAEPTLERLESAFMNAHKAGDKKAAGVLAAEIKRRRAAASVKKEPPTPQQEMMSMPDEFTGEATPEAKKFIPGVARELAQGLTFGGAGELAGAGRGAMAALRGEDFMPAFQSGMGEFEAKRKEFKEEYPASALTAEIAGSLPTGIAAGARLAGAKLLPRLLAPAAGGATYGFLGTEGGLEERGYGAGIGAGIAGTLAAGGAALPAVIGAVKEPVAGLLARKVPLTPGQSLGRGAGYVEGLLGRTALGEIAGIPQAQRRAFEQFNVEAVEGVMKPLGYKVDLDEPLTEAVNQAKIFADKQFKKAVGKSSLPVTGGVVKDFMSLKTPENINRFRKKYKLREKDFSAFKEEIDDAVISRIEDNAMTGDMMQDAVSQLGDIATAKMSGGAADRKIGKALFAYREDFLDYIQSKAKNADEFKRVRDVNRDIRALQKSATGADIFSPEQYRRQLEKQFGPTYMERPQAQLAKEYIDVLGTGRAPVDKPIQDMSFARLAGLLPVGLAGAAAPAVTTAAGVALPAIYRTGRLGTEVARKALQVPGVAMQRAAAMPSVSGVPAGLLAEQ